MFPKYILHMPLLCMYVFWGVMYENIVILNKLIGHCNFFLFFPPPFVLYESDVPVEEMQFV